MELTEGPNAALMLDEDEAENPRLVDALFDTAYVRGQLPFVSDDLSAVLEDIELRYEDSDSVDNSEPIELDLVDEIYMFDDGAEEVGVEDEAEAFVYFDEPNLEDDEVELTGEEVEYLIELGCRETEVLTGILNDTEWIVSYFGESYRPGLEANADIHEVRINEILYMLRPYGITIDDLM